MMTCIPESMVNWNFQVEGAAAGAAAITFDFLTEQGGIRCGDTDYAVQKQGMLSGEWILDNNGQVCARASKENPLARVFQVEEQGNSFLLKAQIMGRSYEIFQGDNLIGNITPANIFSRQSTIDCGPVLSEPGQLFCFWLAALTWRRDHK